MTDYKPCIEVLMPTYNGERFLAAQLDSILGQRGFFDVKISVRDDGSTDGTREILKHYESFHGIHVIYGTNIGVNASMMALVNQANADFYAFSDQDDIWYDFRLQEALGALQLLKKDKPLLWTCREELTDENLHPIGMMPTPKYLGDFHNAVIQNKAPGHTQVFNQALLNLLKGYPPEEIFVYDWVVYLLACAFGTVVYHPQSCGKYRQHNQNAIGYSTGGFAHLRRRVLRLLSGRLRGIVNQQAYFYSRYGKRLTEGHRALLEGLANNRHTLTTRLRYALTTKVRRDTLFETLQFRLLYFFGVF